MPPKSRLSFANEPVADDDFMRERPFCFDPFRVDFDAVEVASDMLIKTEHGSNAEVFEGNVAGRETDKPDDQ
jgi:hypothetical protein